ncbi:MAG: OmpH family outer membrane protein [Verrucomicrobiota bacterium]
MHKQIKQLLGVALASLVVHGSLFAQAPGGRIATIDLNRLFTEYYKTPVASAKLKDTAELFNKEHDEMLAQYRKLVDDLNKLREEQDKTEYTPEVREQKKKAIQDKLTETQAMQRNIEEYRAGHRQMLDQQTQRMRQNIIKEIKEIVLKESRDAGYGIVFDKSGNTANGEPTIIYSQDSIDITEDMLKVLNKNKPTESPKVEEKSSNKPAEKK